MVKRLPFIVGFLLSALTLGSLLGQIHWTLDVLSHFNLQYTIWLAVCLVTGLIIGRRRLYALALAPALLANLIIVAPYFLPLTPAVSAAADRLKVVSLNIHSQDPDYEAVIDFLKQYQPDIVMMTEAEPALMALLDKQVGEMYPYVYDESMRGTMGLALLSRRPFLTTETVPLSDTRRRRLLRATIEWQGSVITIYGAHPLPPLNGRWAASRNHELKIIQGLVAAETGPLILLGDFNASPWAYPMRDLVAGTQLRHAALGFGLRPTWYLERVVFGAPLDHIYVSPEVAALSYKIGGDIGSDHIPVMADLTINHQQAQ
ncbi:MAG: endonuclease/exonuclease/phosphatase family protein [Anaerolineaceae bacterium]|nr:endonuclease/exonuclease/phosphatase family protein [Anaerolineaceae bacterium]